MKLREWSELTLIERCAVLDTFGAWYEEETSEDAPDYLGNVLFILGVMPGEWMERVFKSLAHNIYEYKAAVLAMVADAERQEQAKLVTGYR